MSLNEEVEILRNIPIFSKIEPSKLKLLAFTSERITFQADQAIVQQGEAGDSMYIIVEGSADVIVDTISGPLTVATFGNNDFFGETAILCDVPRTATVQAKSELIALRIAKELFFRLGTEFPQMAFEVMREIALRLDRTTNELQQAKNELTQLKAKLDAVGA